MATATRAMRGSCTKIMEALTTMSRARLVARLTGPCLGGATSMTVRPWSSSSRDCQVTSSNRRRHDAHPHVRRQPAEHLDNPGGRAVREGDDHTVGTHLCADTGQVGDVAQPWAGEAPSRGVGLVVYEADQLHVGAVLEPPGQRAGDRARAHHQDA